MSKIGLCCLYHVKMFRSSIIKSIRSIHFENNLLKNTVQPFSLQNVQSTFFNKKFEKSEYTTQSTSSEQQFLVKLKTDPDRFGEPQEPEVINEDDVKEEKYFSEQPLASQKLNTKKYADIIKNLIRKRRIKEAIDVVEVRMLKEDKVKPENYIYNLLIGACGTVGYTKKAFMLFNDMKKRGLQVHPGAYTALFNACANSPWPLTDGLSRARNLRDIMIEKGYTPNDTNYNAMIKAFGRCGDQNMAFSLVDEMLLKGIPVKDDTINFLLQACVNDKEAGFRHALLVWRKLINKNIKPSVYTYNLLLRCVRDCGLGDTESTRNVIDNICGHEKLIEASNITELTKDKGDVEDKSSLMNQISQSEAVITTLAQTKQSNIATVDSNIATIDSRPNLLADIPHLGNIVSLSEITEPEHRLLLIGGCKGFLQDMEKRSCSPNIKTFTQLLDCIPSTLSAEQELLSAMKKSKVKVDIDFYNMLIKKRSMRFDYDNAKKVLQLIHKARYKPDLITYGVLALGCTNQQECVELLEQMKQGSYTLNAEILGAMLSQACHKMNFKYILYVMELCLTENVQPNKKFLQTLDEFKQIINKMGKDKPPSTSFVKNKVTFKQRYKNWLTEIKVDESEDVHPWKQYREPTNNEYNYKPKGPARFKPRRKSQFKIKTSTKQRY